MYLTQKYFSFFSAFLVLTAIFLSDPGKPVAVVSIVILFFSVTTQHLVARYHYRFSRWIRILRALQLWLSFLWSVPLVYLLGRWWGPMWLLFLWTPCTAALHLNRGKTLAISTLVALTLLGIYAVRGMTSFVGWGQASVHAVFIVFFSLFVQSLAQLAMRLRDGVPR